MPKSLTAPCGATRSKSSHKPFNYQSLNDHVALCPDCRAVNGVANQPLLSPATLQAEASELLEMIGSDLPDGAYFALASELGVDPMGLVDDNDDE